MQATLTWFDYHRVKLLLHWCCSCSFWKINPHLLACLGPQEHWDNSYFQIPADLCAFVSWSRNHSRTYLLKQFIVILPALKAKLFLHSPWSLLWDLEPWQFCRPLRAPLPQDHWNSTLCLCTTYIVTIGLLLALLTQVKVLSNSRGYFPQWAHLVFIKLLLIILFSR